ncbi:superoxide dismutase [Paramyrothecium foliicola]|nr:superoxide dismutase [Paramyrothecium foliicola]
MRATALNGRRLIHHVPTLPHDYSQEGVPNLMSPAGFSLAWKEYMTLMVEKLNALTADMFAIALYRCLPAVTARNYVPMLTCIPNLSGTELEDKDTKTIALMTAREPSQAPIFNYASMAHNNHFFFQGISPTGTPMPEPLREELEAAFSSIETLRREFVLTASAMFGPGFVWLVKTPGGADYRLLTTYLAGSPYPGAHWRAQPTDMNTVGSGGSARDHYTNMVSGGKPAGSLPPGGVQLEPLLCLNTWEHAWLLDWGVGAGGNGGKMAFAEAWWELVDWEKVAHKSGVLRPSFKSA